MSGLASIAQNDFAVGMLLGLAPDMQSGVGLVQAANGIIDDDGDVRLRGPTARKSTNATTYPLTWMWSGQLGDDNYILAADGSYVYMVSGNVLTPIAGAVGLPLGFRSVVIGADLYLPNRVKLHGAGGVITASLWAPPTSVGLASDYHLATIAGRLIVSAGDRVAFSASGDTTTFDANDYHVISGGVGIRGLYAVQDTLMVFTDYGLWTITNMAYDLTDPEGNVQQTLTQVTPDLSLMLDSGLTPYHGRVVAPCTDGVYLVDPVNAPLRISDSIAPLWAQLVQAHFFPGGAKVYHDTLFLPMVVPPYYGSQWRMLTCRLNRPVRARYLYYPWAELHGHAARQTYFDFSDPGGSSTPQLLSGGADGYINDFTGVLNGNGGLDADGQAPELLVETRDLPIAQGQPSHLKRIRVLYAAQAFGTARLELSYSTDTLHTTWTSLPPQPLNYGDDPIACWVVPVKRARYTRVRLRLQDPTVSFTLRRVELQTRTAAHAR